MFKIENEKLIWGDSEYALPDEVKGKVPKKIFGTATAGIEIKRGILIELNGASATVILVTGERVAGHLIGPSPKNGCLVYLREQMDPSNPNKTFWLVSERPLAKQLNWITTEFEDGTRLRLCPFTMYYKVWRE